MKYIIPERKNQYDYVGFNIEKNDTQFIFPCQFISDFDSFKESEKRNIAKRLLTLIRTAKQELDGGSDEEVFQFNSMIWILQNFIEKGYYFEQEVIVKSGVSGKINWKKTIKNNDIWFDNGNIIYKKMFSNVKQIDDSAIISEIYKYCLNIAVNYLGFVFGIETCEKSIYGLKDINFMVYYLKDRRNNTFLDYKKLLFGHMLNILLGGKLHKEKLSLYANDKEFEYVFETLVDNVFGIADKKKFNPTARYVFENEQNEIINVSTLRPDTILEYEYYDEKCYCVIDAKYYSFNYGDKSKSGLPAQSSINKQFVYQKFIETNINADTDNNGKCPRVSSVFILPFCADKNDAKIQYMNGYAEAKWNNQVEGKIYLFKVDLKTLFDSFYNKDTKLRDEFIKILEEDCLKAVK